jgi:dodecin
MAEPVHELIDPVGSSGVSVSDPIRTAIARASATVRNIGWFGVVEVRGGVSDGKIAHYRVTLKVGFTLDGWRPGRRPMRRRADVASDGAGPHGRRAAMGRAGLGPASGRR